MRTITLLIVLTLLSWQNPVGVFGALCEGQMVALFRFAVPLGVVLLLLDVSNFVARFLERRMRREAADYEWLESWVDRLMSRDHRS
jgi:hypothetical protein